MNNEKDKNAQLRQRVVTLLTRQQVDFLDKIGKDMLFFVGKKLSRGKIISLLVDILLEYKDRIDMKGVKDPKDLKEKVLEAIKKTQPGNEFPKPFEILVDKEKHHKGQFKDNKNG